MKVLLCVRQDYYRNYGADSVQVLKIYDYLKRNGVIVDINDGGICDYSSYDIIHLFNLNATGEIYKYYKIAHHYKKIIVVSPNYWDLSKYYINVKNNERTKLWMRSKPYRAEILKRCKMIFCNSKEEEAILKEKFINISPCKVIYYGVEVENDDIPLYNFKERNKLNKYILCVGRICELKNQYTLAKICNELKYQLVLIGNISDTNYFKKCMKFKNVKYFGFMDSYNIYNAYRFAKVHVNCSYSEMPGLSSLEAAACGCKVVSTAEGCAYEYFGDLVNYNNPYDEKTIIDSIEKCIKTGKNNKLKEHIVNKFKWDDFSSKVYDYYKKLVESY